MQSSKFIISGIVFVYLVTFQLVASGPLRNTNQTLPAGQDNEQDFDIRINNEGEFNRSSSEFCGVLDTTNSWVMEKPVNKGSKTKNDYPIYDSGAFLTTTYSLDIELQQNDSKHERSLYNAINDKIRVKRANPSGTQKIIEIAIFVDNALFNRVKTVPDTYTGIIEVFVRIRSICDQALLLLNYSTLDVKFHLEAVKFDVMTNKQNVPNPAGGDSAKYLRNFCEWQKKLNSRNQWDHAILYTGIDLKLNKSGFITPDLAGAAYLGGMCHPDLSCTIVEGYAFDAAFITAHELAHSLGAPHDGAGNSCENKKYIMTEISGMEKMRWSSCSNAYIKRFLASGRAKCISDSTSRPMRLESMPLPGLTNSLDKQCALSFGGGYRAYKNNNNVCDRLWCENKSSMPSMKPLSTTSLFAKNPALDGSPCDKGKICLEGVCRRVRIERY